MKNVNECSLTDLNVNILDFKDVLGPVHISGDILCIFFVVSLVEKIKYFWLILPVMLMYT